MLNNGRHKYKDMSMSHLETQSIFRDVWQALTPRLSQPEAKTKNPAANEQAANNRPPNQRRLLKGQKTHSAGCQITHWRQAPRPHSTTAQDDIPQ